MTVAVTYGYVTVTYGGVKPVDIYRFWVKRFSYGGW